MMEKFTKGPWTIDARGENLIGRDGKDVSLWGCHFSMGQKTEEREANNNLVENAENLYTNLLKMVTDFCEECGGCSCEPCETCIQMEPAYKALAKARGES